MDPPVLARIRRVVTHAFGPRQLDRMTPWVRSTVDGCLDAMEAEGPGADVVAHLSDRLPLEAICELLGIPAGDRPVLRARAVAMMAMTPGAREAAVTAKLELRSYFEALTVRRRAEPGEDLVSALATARIGDETLTDAELAVLAQLLMVSGHDTTTYDISNMVFTLLTHPAQLARLRAARPCWTGPSRNSCATSPSARASASRASPWRTSRSAGSPSAPETPSTSRTSPPTATRRSTSAPTTSTSNAPPRPPTWPSAGVRTTASVRTWPG